MQQLCVPRAVIAGKHKMVKKISLTVQGCKGNPAMQDSCHTQHKCIPLPPPENILSPGEASAKQDVPPANTPVRWQLFTTVPSPVHQCFLSWCQQGPSTLPCFIEAFAQLFFHCRVMCFCLPESFEMQKRDEATPALKQEAVGCKASNPNPNPTPPLKERWRYNPSLPSRQSRTLRYQYQLLF